MSPEFSKEYEKLEHNQSRSEDWKKLRKFRLTSSKSFTQIVSRKKDFAEKSVEYQCSNFNYYLLRTL